MSEIEKNVKYLQFELSDNVSSVEKLLVKVDDASNVFTGKEKVSEVINMTAVHDAGSRNVLPEMAFYKMFEGNKTSLEELKVMMVGRNNVGRPAFSISEISEEEWHKAKILENRAVTKVRDNAAFKHALKPYEDITDDEIKALENVRFDEIKAMRPLYQDITREEAFALRAVRFEEPEFKQGMNLAMARLLRSR